MTFDFTVKQFILGGGTGTPTFQFYRRGFNIGSSATPSWKEITISGVGSVSLVNAIKDGLVSLRLFGGTELVPETYIDSVTLEGKCEQNGTPTPTVPVDIVCNNGAIKLSPNLVEFNETRINSSTWDNADKTKGFEVYADVYTKTIGSSMLTNANAFGVFVPCKQGESVSLDFFDYAPFYARCFYCEITADRKCNTTPQEYADSTTSTITKKTFTLTQSDSIGFIFEWWLTSQQTRNYTASNYMVVKGSTPPTKYIPYGSIYYDGTVETATDNVGNVATAQPLLSVGDYKDTQEVLSGVVNRNVGIKVFNGTENWAAAPGADNAYLQASELPGVKTNSQVLCSHLINSSTGAMPRIRLASVLRVYGIGTEWTDKADFQQWLADQFNAGFPVIVVYPLETATTETVSGQVLNKEPVTVTGSLTGLVANVVSSTHTTPTPTQPLDIVANNGTIKVSQNLLNPAVLLKPSESRWTYYKNDGFILKAGVTYTLSTEAMVFVYFCDFATSTTIVTGSQSKSYTPTEDIKVYFQLYKSGGIPEDTHIQLEIGSTATTYRPYGSVYYDGTVETVNVHSKNLFDGAWETGIYSTSTGVKVLVNNRIRSVNKIIIQPATTYTLSLVDATPVARWCFYDENQEFISSASKATATTPDNAHYATIYLAQDYTVETAPLCQIEVGSTATTYEPYFNGGSLECPMLLSVGS